MTTLRMYAFLFIVFAVSLDAQNYLYINDNFVSQSGCIGIRYGKDNTDELQNLSRYKEMYKGEAVLRSKDGTVEHTLPYGTDVYIRDEGIVEAVGLSTFSAKEGLNIVHNGKTYNANGVWFYPGGEVYALWLNDTTRIVFNTEEYSARLAIFQVSPFKYPSLSFSLEGNYTSIYQAGRKEILIGGRKTEIQDIVVFYPSGKLMSVSLADPRNLQSAYGTLEYSRAGYYENGALQYIVLTQPQRIETRYGRLQCTGLIDFHQNGTIKELTIDGEAVLDGRTYTHAPVQFSENGGLLD